MPGSPSITSVRDDSAAPERKSPTTASSRSRPRSTPRSVVRLSSSRYATGERLRYEHMFAFMSFVQLAFDSLDRLVDLVEERGGHVAASEAATHLFRIARGPEGLARSLLAPLVGEDARLVWRGSHVALAGPTPARLDEAQLAVFDLETTALANT